MQKYILENKVYAYSVGFFLVTTIFHWRLTPDLGIILYWVGALLGLHLLEFLETAVKMTPSPFRSILSQAIITILTIFVLTSSSNPLGKGLVLLLNLRYLWLQQQEMKEKGNLASWGQSLLAMDEVVSRNYLRLLWVFMGLETFIFILV